MDLRLFSTFLRVAELQNFTKAAEQLGYSQATVTVQIHQLEQALGIQLFERIGKRLRKVAVLRIVKFKCSYSLLGTIPLELVEETEAKV